MSQKERHLYNAASGSGGRKGLSAFPLTKLAQQHPQSPIPVIQQFAQSYPEGRLPQGYHEGALQMYRTGNALQARFYAGGQANVAQLIDWAYWTKMGSGFLVLSEGILTTIAASLGFHANPSAAVPTFFVGGGKILRGLNMMLETFLVGKYPDHQDQIKEWMGYLTKTLRAIEATEGALAVGLGAWYSDANNEMIKSLVAMTGAFAGLKVIRSIAHFFIDKGQTSYGSMILQGIEALEGGILALAAIWNPSLPGTVAAGGVGGSKVLRGTA
ncbi:MAG: hypothetical protein AAF206_30260, partial [Bacteroidota bacterium]